MMHCIFTSLLVVTCNDKKCVNPHVNVATTKSRNKTTRFVGFGPPFPASLVEAGQLCYKWKTNTSDFNNEIFISWYYQKNVLRVSVLSKNIPWTKLFTIFGLTNLLSIKND